MKSLTKLFIILVMVSLVGFTVVENDNSGKSNDISVTEIVPEVEQEKTTSIIAYEDIGQMVASWYGPRFHGRLTANGEIYNQMAFTAAHKKFRFGTLLKVTNPDNNNSVIVRINDRGPYIRGRHLDLSKAAAQSLGIIEKGVAKVQIEQISLKGVNFPVITLN